MAQRGRRWSPPRLGPFRARSEGRLSEPSGFEAPVDSVIRGFFFGLIDKEDAMKQRLLLNALQASIYLVIAVGYLQAVYSTVLIA